jgi:hypothetical protein
MGIAGSSGPQGPEQRIVERARLVSGHAQRQQ